MTPITRPQPVGISAFPRPHLLAAAGLFERGDARAARTLLVEAAGHAESVSPVFAAVLHQQVAETLPGEAVDLAIDHLQRAQRLGGNAALPRLHADIWMRLGTLHQARDVQDSDADPDPWASVTLNLASALQYLPSTHPAENLAEAVELYEEVLAVRTEARDPVAHARVLLNQGNALAHLGIFKPAIEKRAKALKLFTWHDATDEASTAKDLLDGIHARMDDIRSTTG